MLVSLASFDDDASSRVAWTETELRSRNTLHLVEILNTFCLICLSLHRTFLSRSTVGFQMGFLSLCVKTIEIRVWLFGFIEHFIDPKVAFYCVARFALCAIDKYTYDNDKSTYIYIYLCLFNQYLRWHQPCTSTVRFGLGNPFPTEGGFVSVKWFGMQWQRDRQREGDERERVRERQLRWDHASVWTGLG